ncbi:MAG: ATP-binding protein [Desulfobacterales bacterium]|nr:ATP-binding protein [Desulfobacterales bacterium]
MGAIPPNEKIHFLRAMTISSEAPQLEEMQDKLCASLSAALGISKLKAKPLIQNLLSALFKWTTSLRGENEWVTPEDVMQTLAESEPDIFGYCDVPTPAPYFPSREAAADAITELLTRDAEHQVVFLEASPGSGKTSVVSRIVNQRADDYSTLTVDIRYYAYKPITPDSPALPADADLSASPESLWYSLLSQVRERLRGRLMEFRVPVRNHFITASEARDNVLRLSTLLAKDKRTPFVIVIDGIDHAARAHRKGIPSLLESLPAPEVIPNGVRILIAGQPAAGYPEYPIWLRTHHRLVAKIGLGPIKIQDTRLLLNSSPTKISAENLEHAARIIQGVADGNTLAMVFSVAEAERCQGLDELQERLTKRQLHSGVHAYYQAIWNAAIPASPSGIAPYLSSVLCILRERVTGTMMHEAFPAWGKPAPEWDAILTSLEPLVVHDERGFRVKHNDIRVFLEGEMRTDNTALMRVASLLANYYMGPSADPYFRQESVFTLLGLSGRAAEKARIFNPAWVLDAAAYGRDISAIQREAEEAFQAVPDLRDWDAALDVACGGLTLAKLTECIDASPELLERSGISRKPLPQCLETERFVLPFNRWNDSTIRRILSDAKILFESAEIDRAKGLMEHWLSGISPMAIATSVAGMIDNHGIRNEKTLAIGVGSLFEDWGLISFRLEIQTDRGDPTSDLENEATYLFEKGWITTCVVESDQEGAFTRLKAFNPRYIGTLEVAIEEASKKGMWDFVGNLLVTLTKNKDGLNFDFRIKAAYWSLKALGADSAKDWLAVLPEVRTGQYPSNSDEMPLMIYLAKVIGWVEPQREASSIAAELVDTIILQRRHVHDRGSLLLPLKAAAMIGIIERMLRKKDPSSAAALVPPSTVRGVIELIWKNRHSPDLYEFRGKALNLTFELIKHCLEIGGAHGEMVLSLSLSNAELFPVDQRMPVLWEILRSRGYTDVLYRWANHWIGEQGAAWSGVDFSERAEIVDKMSHIAREEGWDEMATAAETKLRHHLIGYSTHKEYAFREPLDWLGEMVRHTPCAWCEEGIQLLELCRECDDQGGDNRFRSDIKAEVAAAAFRCGPASAWAFFHWFDKETQQHWLQTVRATLTEAIKRVISDGTVTNPTDILALWSCAVGLTRWFDKYQAQTLTAIRDSIIAKSPPEGRDDLLNRMRSITPGEVLREEYDKDGQNHEPMVEDGISSTEANKVEDAVAALVLQVEGGQEPSLLMIGQLALRIARDNPANREKLMSTIFELVDTNSNYSTKWGYWGKAHPLRNLVPAIREHEVWELMRAAIRSVGTASWTWSVPHNVHLICLFYAAGKGIEQLKRGAQSVLAMHRLWARLPEGPGTDVKEHSVENSVNNWSCFSALVLRRMLSADSAETISAALRGLAAVVEVLPENLPIVFSHCGQRERSWLLLCMEVWAARHPKVIAPVLEEMCIQEKGGKLLTKIQLWICRLMLGKTAAGGKPNSSFMPTAIRESEGYSQILTRRQKLLKAGSRAEGSTRLANTYSAAHGWISRIAKVTGHDTNDLESKIAEAINTQPPNMDESLRPSIQRAFATEDGDMIITGGMETILDDVLTLELRKPEWSENDASNIAIAITQGDDPWIVRQSPLPSPPSFDWPEQKEVENWLDSKTDNGEVLNRLRLLTRGDDLQDGQVTLGSYLRLFTSHYDFEMWYWLEHVRSEGNVASRAPLCPSGRCFQLFLSDRFEPQPAGRAPLVFFSRSFLSLSFSTLEIIPAKLLQEHLRWEPSAENPLVWHKDGRIIAKYERYHGPLNYNWSRRHMRKPTLSRWVVSAEELAKIPRLAPQWMHETYSFSED